MALKLKDDEEILHIQHTQNAYHVQQVKYQQQQNFEFHIESLIVNII